MVCLFCFTTTPLTNDEMKGKYGGAFNSFKNNNENFDISLCQAPCKEPMCWCASMACFCPAQVCIRHKVLNHVHPGSGWSNYKCCQGYFGGCCCIQPGEMGEKKCPVPCMLLEACLCPGPAVSASSNVIRDRYSLGLDDDDVRLIRCSNCLFYFSVCLSCISPFTDCEGDDTLAGIVNIVSDVVFCCVGGCMTAQVNREMKLKGPNPPHRQLMEGRS